MAALNLFVAAAVLLIPAVLTATSEGLPVARSGANGEMACEECHRNTTGGEASVSVEVGPYVPGAEAQPVNVVIVDAAATSWGFQLAARRADDLSVPAGTFEVFNNFARVWCADGTMAPCAGGEMQYATHTSAGTATGPAASRTFTVNWIAPAEDVGDVVFTVAALGADGDLGTNGDRTAVDMATSLYAPSNSPTISGVVSAAAFSAAGEGIAPGSLITLFGENLAAPDVERNVAQGDFDPRGFIPEELNRLAVEFITSDDPTPFRGRIIYLDSGQVNLQAPDFEVTEPAQGGDEQTVGVQVILNPDQGMNEVRSDVMEAPTQRTMPALFTLDSSGQGAAAALHADGRIVAATDAYPGSFPAAPGETVSVYGSGFGPTDPSFEPGELAEVAELATPPTAVEIGGMMADVVYAGTAPGYAGLYQFNVTVPDLPSGEYEIVIRTGMTSTPAGVTIAVGE